MRKKLIEVALPLEEINAASAKEKSIRQGHPSTLHLWWARRPLAACRAVLFGQLVDDPSGYADELKKNKQAVQAAEKALTDRLKVWKQKKADYDKADEAGMKVSSPGEEPTLEAVLIERERERLFKIIRELVKWENTTNESVLEPAREEIRKSWRRTCRRDGNPEDMPMPPFLDPFAGGGSIPMEAQRLGLEAHASDLNPVAVLINKAMIEIPPKFAGQPPINPDWQTKSKEEKAATTWTGAQGLAEDVCYYGQWMRREAFKRIGHLYPPYKLTQELIDSRPDLKKAAYKDGDELTVITWLWARTVPSPNPALNGKAVPLTASFWLSKKKGKEAYVEPIVENGDYRFEIRVGKPTDTDVTGSGTKTGRGANFVCLLSGVPMGGDHIKSEGKAGRMKARLMAVVCAGKRGRVYLPPNARQEESLKEKSEWLPTQKLNHDPRAIWTPPYGLETYADLFTDRQLVALNTFCDLVPKARKQALADAQASRELPNVKDTPAEGDAGSDAYADAMGIFMGLAVSRSTNTINALAVWSQGREQTVNLFSRQAIPMTWDFPEASFFANAAGDFALTTKSMSKALLGVPANLKGYISQQDASSVEQEDLILSTDPPYYDNIGYADLSDFFYVWLRRSLQDICPSIFDTLLVPKTEELIAAPYRQGGKESAEKFFLNGMQKCLKTLLRKSINSIPVTIYYAFKQSETKGTQTFSKGWATFLQALIDAGFLIDATWPLRTERPTGVKVSVNALASSIVLVCRLRQKDASMATRREFVQDLNRELPAALRELQRGNITPVDLPQSSIGPGMAIFSRYSKIVEADGSSMPVHTALQLINQNVDEFLSEQESQMDDWTRFTVTWFSQHGFKPGKYGDAETIAVAKGVAVDGVAEAGIIESGAGKVRILRIDELPEDWDPAGDDRLTVWEIVHHLARRLENEGVDGTAPILKQVGGLAEDARALCYRLYTICEQNNWADEGRTYNSLITEWLEITQRAESLDAPATPTQQELI